jgi:hypothetical protein
METPETIDMIAIQRFNGEHLEIVARAVPTSQALAEMERHQRLFDPRSGVVIICIPARPAPPSLPPALADAGWAWEVDPQRGYRVVAGDTATGWHDDPALAVRDTWYLAEPDHDVIEAIERAERITAQALHYREALETIMATAHMLIPGAAAKMACEALASEASDAMTALGRHPFLAEVAEELERAQGQHAPLNSAHEAHSVILEELEGFWLEVKKKRSERSPDLMRAELAQLAATAARTVEDLHL